MKKIYLVVIALMMGLVVLTGCGKGEATAEDNNLYCPLDHEVISQMPTRAVVVSIDNAPAARPQSGVSQADLLYELPAEGGISRILAVFYHGTADTIGPVRSARPYLVDVAREWQAAYVHAGGSEDALTYLASGVVPDINEFAYGSSFWRDSDRKAPHNLYTSSENLQNLMSEKGWNEQITLTAWPFLVNGQTQLSVLQEAEDQLAQAEGRAADYSSIEQANQIHIDYISAQNVYVYDASTGDYLRYIGDEPYIDAVNGQQIAVKNIIVQKVTSKVLDNEGRLAIDMSGEGEALLFSGGIVRHGRWVRDSLDERTKFVDEQGNEWPLAPGKTWIQVTDQTVDISYEQVDTNTDNTKE